MAPNSGTVCALSPGPGREQVVLSPQGWLSLQMGHLGQRRLQAHLLQRTRVSVGSRRSRDSWAHSLETLLSQVPRSRGAGPGARGSAQTARDHGVDARGRIRARETRAARRQREGPPGRCLQWRCHCALCGNTWVPRLSREMGPSTQRSEVRCLPQKQPLPSLRGLCIPSCRRTLAVFFKESQCPGWWFSG